MKKNAFIFLLLILFLVIVFPSNVLAQDYIYTDSFFWYRGKIYHMKDVIIFGGTTYFLIDGVGSAEGQHLVQSLDLPSLNKINTHIKLNLSGTTSVNNARDLIKMEQEALDFINMKREQAIALLNNSFFISSPLLTGEEYAREMTKIKEQYDELEKAVKESYQDAKKNMRILAGTNIVGTAEVDVGVEMNPGESGYIKQDIYHTENSGGQYTQINSQFGNTGGITKRQLDVNGYISDKMHVEGYAEVWETSTVTSGNAKSGWWDMIP